MAFEITLLLDIAAILILAKILGEVAERMRLDSMLGELAAGLILGPILLWVSPTPLLEGIAFLGLMIMMFFIGLDVSYEDIKKQSYAGGVMGAFTVVFAFLGGLALGVFVLDSLMTGVVLGVAMMGTSTVIPLKLAAKAGIIKTKLGQVMVSMAMADDVATIVALSLLARWVMSGSIDAASAATLFFAVLGFILFILAFGSKLLERVLNLFSRMKDSQVMLSIPLALAFLIAFISNEIGIAAITGAFLAGASMSGSRHAKERIEPQMRAIGYGFFIPVFFAYSAIIVDLQILSQFLWLIGAVTAVAIAGKVAGVLATARFYGFRGKETGILSLSTVPRGEYAIAIAQIALGMGVIMNEIYGAIIGMAIITLVITPILFKLYTRKGYYKGF